MPRYKRYLLRALLAVSVLAGVGAYLFYAIRYQHLHVPIMNWFSGHQQNHDEWNNPLHQADSFNLADYHLAYSRSISEIENNLSWLSYWDERGELLAVLNKPPTILTLDLEGHITAQYPLDGISDTEGIAYLGNGQIALSNEKHGRIVLTQLPDQPSAVDLSHAPTLALGPTDTNNSGLEGIEYDRIQDLLYIVKEHSPKALYRISGLCATKPQCSFDNIHIEDLSHWLDSVNFVHDFSSVVIEPTRGHVILLSEQNQSLLELDDTGEPRSYRPLNLFPEDLNIPQAEGITLDSTGNLYLVSEPNLFYIFTR